MKRILWIAGFVSLSLGAQQNSQFEQWHKMKYGRYSPREEARQKDERASTAYREEKPTPAPKLSRAEEWFRAKFGRSTPAEERKEKAARANEAFREKPKDPAAEKRWLQEQREKGKFGRVLSER